MMKPTVTFVTFDRVISFVNCIRARRTREGRVTDNFSRRVIIADVMQLYGTIFYRFIALISINFYRSVIPKTFI